PGLQRELQAAVVAVAGVDRPVAAGLALGEAVPDGVALVLGGLDAGLFLGLGCGGALGGEALLALTLEFLALVEGRDLDALDEVEGAGDEVGGLPAQDLAGGAEAADGCGAAGGDAVLGEGVDGGFVDATAVVEVAGLGGGHVEGLDEQGGERG